MIKSYKLNNLECANCAAKMEADISKLNGINEATIAFMTSRMKLDIADGTDIDTLFDEAQKIIHQYEEGCDIVRR